MSGYMKYRKALKLFGSETKGISRKTKYQRKALYDMVIDAGFYWDVGLGQWIPYKRLAQRIKEEFGPEAEWEYLLVLQNAGILDQKRARTNKVNLPAQYTQKLDSFIMNRVLKKEN